jgi:PAS domain S-box-containing protein
MNSYSNKNIFENEFLFSLCDGIREGAAIMEKSTGVIIYHNKCWLDFLEFDPTCRVDRVMLNEARKYPLTSGEIAEREKNVSEKGIFSEQAEYISKRGHPFWGELTIRAFKNKGQEYYLLVLDNIDNLKEAQQLASEEEERFKAFFEHASMGILVVNQRAEITEVNAFALKQFGYTKTEMLGSKIELLIPSRFGSKHIEHREKYIQQPSSRPMGVGLDLSAAKKDGTEFPVEVSLGNYTSHGEKYVIAFISDISVRKRAQEEVEKLNNELEATVEQRTSELRDTMYQLELSKEELSKLLIREKELSELKSRFVSMASHEFRTPLSTVLSSAYLVEKYTSTEDQPKREKHLQRIISSVNMLTDILNDFLSVGKIEEGKIQVRWMDFDLQKNTDAIIQELKQNAKKGQQINYRHNGKVMVNLDPSLLKHMLMNLISNAIKFSPEGAPIEIKTAVTDSLILISVKDNGIGISKEDQEHLMERFFRGANATNIQGTGLGLHIVAKYAELMNGRLSCISELEQGTEFLIQLNIRPSEKVLS